MIRRLRTAAAGWLPVWMLAGGVFVQAQEWENPVKKQLREGQPVIGATLSIPSADVAAQAANLGYDFLWIEMEHSAITLESARNMILATRGLKAIPFIRVPVNELWTAKRALDTGALGVVFPFTSTPELARQAVAACKYPPVGKRGSGAGLASMRWPAPEGYQKFADRNAMVIVIVEDALGVSHVEEIAAVEGIDVLFIGTSDLSFSLGHGNQPDHPTVQAAIARIVAAAKRNNVPLGRPSGNPQQIQEFIKQGFTFFQGPSELSMMSSGARLLLQPMGKSGLDPKKQLLY